MHVTRGSSTLSSSPCNTTLVVTVPCRMRDARDQTSWQSSDGTRMFAYCSSFPTCISARRGCQAGALLDFLRYHDADDDLPGRRHRRRLAAARRAGTGRRPHNDVVQKLLRKARKGARIIYVPGNHDEFLRGYYGTHFGGIEVAEHAIHEGADGRALSRRSTATMFDLVVKHARWLALLGDKAYDFAILRQPHLQRGAPAARLSLLVAVAMGEAKVKNAVNYIGDFEQALAEEAQPPARRRRDLRPYPSRRDPRRCSASATSIAATGSRAAPPSSSMRTADSRSLPGPRLMPCVRFCRRRSSGWRKSEKSRREPCRCRSFPPGRGMRLRISFRGTKAPSATCWQMGGRIQRSVIHHLHAKRRVTPRPTRLTATGVTVRRSAATGAGRCS